MKDLLEKYGIRDFTEGELFRKCIPPAVLYENILPTLCILQKIRDTIGVPIFIHSAYRDPVYNYRVHGAIHSLHLKFNALDFSPLRFDSAQVRNLFYDIVSGKFNLEMQWKGNLISVNEKLMGIGLYPAFIHLDTRGVFGRKGVTFNGPKSEVQGHEGGMGCRK
ncbi:MAG: D-Ala-D-Ala carboxypeptidase family metallohydrolase [Acidobacteriota bacterium]